MSLDPNTKKSAAKPGVLSLVIKEKGVLFNAYMPYIKGGGLFIPTNKPFKMGDEVFMLLSLMGDPTKLKIVGKVIWVSPAAQNGRPQGIGVQFSEKGGGAVIKNQIEKALGSALKSNHSTHTM